jgi:hypothetical protein
MLYNRLVTRTWEEILLLRSAHFDKLCVCIRMRSCQCNEHFVACVQWWCLCRLVGFLSIFQPTVLWRNALNKFFVYRRSPNLWKRLQARKQSRSFYRREIFRYCQFPDKNFRDILRRFCYFSPYFRMYIRIYSFQNLSRNLLTMSWGTSDRKHCFRTSSSVFWNPTIPDLQITLNLLAPEFFKFF